MWRRAVYNIKLILSRHQSAYAAAVKLYVKLSKFAVRLTAYQSDRAAKQWRARDVDSAEKYWSVRTNATANDFLRKQIMRYEANSVLEVGCNCGNRLYSLARMRPHARFVGLDINQTSVSFGNAKFIEEGVRNVTLECRRAEGLASYPSGSFDIVYSWATLIYPKPAVIKDILANMVRISRLAVVLIEMQSKRRLSGRRKYGIYCGGNWKRDYRAIAEEIDKNLVVETERVFQHVWNPGGGGATVIRIVKAVQGSA
jgi:ubiquinone/menaquinone biosynthesis C-methylase UbiE